MRRLCRFGRAEVLAVPGWTLELVGWTLVAVGSTLEPVGWTLVAAGWTLEPVGRTPAVVDWKPVGTGKILEAPGFLGKRLVAAGLILVALDLKPGPPGLIPAAFAPPVSQTIRLLYLIFSF